MLKILFIATIALSSLLVGCAGFVTSNDMQGLEVYRPAYCFIVSESNASVFTCPNLASSYLIKPRSFLAKNDFSVELSSGMLEKVTDELDTTAILTFFQGAAETAAKAAGSAVAEGSVDGNIGLEPGFYFWDGSGPLRRIDSGGAL
ncbi:MAG: hypothetical protein JRG90_18990 [Deltaproteobacteria bacterium]|nr:hypothetical protein [Deltaproteobacteria bacterium]